MSRPPYEFPLVLKSKFWRPTIPHTQNIEAMNRESANATAGAYWTRTELAQAGVNDSRVSEPDLNDPIHALFRYRNQTFRVTEMAEDEDGVMQAVDHDPVSQAEWDFYKPALRLASILVSKPAYQKWWVTLVCGNVDPASCILAVPIGDWNDLQRRTKAMMEVLAQHLTFSFNTIEYGSWGATHGNPEGVEIELNRSFILFAQQAMRQRTRGSGRASGIPAFAAEQQQNNEPVITADHTNRMQWMMAITLSHELNHALWQWRYRHLIRGDANVSEPFHGMDPRRLRTEELGDAWECHLMGYKAQAIDDDEIAYHSAGQRAPEGILANGLAASFYGMNWPVSGAEDVLCPMPAQYINSWFKTETWALVDTGQSVNWRHFVNSSPLVTVLDAEGNSLGRITSRR